MRLLLLFLLLFPLGFAQKSGGGVGGRVYPRPAPAPIQPPPVQPAPIPSLPLPYPTVRVYHTGGGGLPLFVFLGLLGIALAIVWGLNRAAPDEKTSVARLRLGLLVNEALKKKLRALADGADTTTPEGLAALLDEAVVLLLRERPNWRWASYEVFSGDESKASQAFEAWVAEERSRYEETYRHYGGKKWEAAHTPILEPGGRYMIVSLIALQYGEFPPSGPIDQRTLQERLLAFAATTPATLLGAYLVWSPEKEGEALTDEELLVGYPRLLPI
ncbi:MAG: DUF1517 domain-containing protein [Thermaceae bacterium]